MPIFDQGYQHWQGRLAGHGWRWLAVARHGVRAQLQNRVVRSLLMLSWLPALALVGLLTLWGLVEQQSETALGLLAPFLPAEVLGKPGEFRATVWTIGYTYFFQAELVCMVFLVLLVGPNLVSRDLRFNALPLYLSRPVRRVDYFVGKLGVVAFFLGATTAVPAVGAYLLGLAFSLDLGVVRDTYRLLLAGVGFGLVVALSAGTLILALSSLSRRSVYVGLAWAGLVLLSNLAATILAGIEGDTAYREELRAGMDRWVRDHPPPPGVTMSNGFPAYPTPPGDRPLTAAEQAQRKYQKDWEAARRRQYGKARAAVEARQAGDWRPLVAYTANLGRVGDGLLGADEAKARWAKVRERARGLVAPGEVEADEPPPPPVPWHWSAAVLAGVWVVSVVVLSRRVKSLDRLK